MVNYCIADLQQLKAFVEGLSDENFRKKSPSLFNSSIGEHVRHILEFYACLIKGVEVGIINYDKRKRQKTLENQTDLCASQINSIINKLNTIPHDSPLKVEANFSKTNLGINFALESSLQRELGYCLEHSVHHKALIKTALKEYECLELVDDSFGIAASTIRSKNICVQ